MSKYCIFSMIKFLSLFSLSFSCWMVVVESPYLESASSVSVGRTLFDRGSLYVSSAGPFNAASSTNTTITGGIVARVDLPKVK